MAKNGPILPTTTFLLSFLISQIHQLAKVLLSDATRGSLPKASWSEKTISIPQLWIQNTHGWLQAYQDILVRPPRHWSNLDQLNNLRIQAKAQVFPAWSPGNLKVNHKGVHERNARRTPSVPTKRTLRKFQGRGQTYAKPHITVITENTTHNCKNYESPGGNQ